MTPDEQLVTDLIPENGTIHIDDLKAALVAENRYDLVRQIGKMKRRKVLHYTQSASGELAHVARGRKVWDNAN